jgi:DNA-directed RNA polymerase specialized sigma24 family protein
VRVNETDIAKYLKALVVMQARGREQGEAISILSDCEFTSGEIAEMIGATKAAVQKRIERARKEKK